MISDIEASALSIAMQRGLSEYSLFVDPADEGARAARLTARGFDILTNGAVRKAVESLTIGRRDDLLIPLAALAMQAGGIRVFGIVFCATHYPAGVDARRRYACPKCDPEALAVGDPRDVITIEGNI